MITRDSAHHPHNTTIVFAGRIAGVSADGAHDVRLDNGHHVQAYDAKGQRSGPRPDVGARVSVEMAPNDMRGWRLRTAAPSPRSRPPHAAVIRRRLGPEGAI